MAELKTRKNDASVQKFLSAVGRQKRRDGDIKPNENLLRRSCLRPTNGVAGAAATYSLMTINV